jgi:hypothetical protein
MAPLTPQSKAKRHEYDTTRRVHFFDVYDKKLPSTSLTSICRRPDINIPPATARRWLTQRDILGSPALRRTRRTSQKLGRDFIISESTLDRLIDQSDPIHEKSYPEQVEELSCAPRTLQANLSSRRNARRYQKIQTKEISESNKVLRVRYGIRHEKKTLTGHWQYVYFTDEVHFNSADLQNKVQYELRQPGQKRSERIQEVKSSGLNLTIHVAAGVSYNYKGPLIFYKDPAEPGPKPYKPRQPRKSSVQTAEEYQQQVQAWKASQPPKADVTPKGNAMSQIFYTEHILPHHIKHIQRVEALQGHKFLFQEDGDPSHGKRSQDNVAARLKADSDLQLFAHPAQSPDLNPIESIWQIIKQRLRGGEWHTVQEFKEAIQREWDRITQAQIRRRIRDMPSRCKELTVNNGERIKSYLW